MNSWSQPQKNFNPETGCLGKEKYYSYAKAQIALKHRGHRIDRNRGAADLVAGKIQIYKCPMIDPKPHFHIGKSGKRPAKNYNRKEVKRLPLDVLPE